MTERLVQPRELDPLERAIAFAIREAVKLRRTRAEEKARRTMTGAA